VIAHLPQPGIEVTIAGRDYSGQEVTGEPLVLHLPPGRYNFPVRRGATVLHAETFALRRGETTVLAAMRDEPRVLAPRRPRPANRRARGGSRNRSRPHRRWRRGRCRREPLDEASRPAELHLPGITWSIGQRDRDVERP
jgi:hypothetical protein